MAVWLSTGCLTFLCLCCLVCKTVIEMAPGELGIMYKILFCAFKLLSLFTAGTKLFYNFQKVLQ